MIAVTLAVTAACGTSTEQASADPTWTDDVDVVIDELADAFDEADIYQTARFFSAGGTVDLATFGAGVATTPAAVVEVLEDLWFQEPGRAAVRAWQVFVTPTTAHVAWGAYDPNGFQNWMQSYVFGPGGRTASVGFRALEFPWDEYRDGEAEVVDLLDRYIAAWETNDATAMADVYAADVVVSDPMHDRVWRGFDDVMAGAGLEPIEHGPWPQLYVYRDGSEGAISQAIAVVQLGGECPTLQARRWVLDGNRIVTETRLTHVPSARRCERAAPDGWWSTFELPDQLLDNVTEVLDAGSHGVELINAEPAHEQFTRWLFERFRTGGIGVPDVAAVWFPPAPECAGAAGYAHYSDQRYAGRRTAIVCFTDDELSWERAESGWSRAASFVGLHEFAHVWMIDHLDDDDRAAFIALAGLPSWSDADVPADRRGVEHAAFTIAWGLAGTEDARYPLRPQPACDALAQRYELLTDRVPITECGPDGWTPR